MKTDNSNAIISLSGNSENASVGKNCQHFSTNHINYSQFPDDNPPVYTWSFECLTFDTFILYNYWKKKYFELCIAYFCTC